MLPRKRLSARRRSRRSSPWARAASAPGSCRAASPTRRPRPCPRRSGRGSSRPAPCRRGP
ncbi:MAG: hypothetical protein FJ137_13030 [Deltaproteobacteria bacterium]|nr:hypothetical protein [Deltaproteobacteria bacterium]